MTPSGSVTQWADDLGHPDQCVREEAARRIWERYASQLFALARRNLDQRLRVRTGADDVLQSMFRNFYMLRREDKVPLGSRDDLLALLVRMTLWKVRNAANHHCAGCRDYRRERVASAEGADDAPLPHWMLKHMEHSEPTPVEADALDEELERWLRVLPDALQRIALWKMEGCTNEQIARKIGRTVRAVELKLKWIREKWAPLLEQESAD